MLSFNFDEIARRAVADPGGLVSECDAHLSAQVEGTAAYLRSRMRIAPVVLLAGPSGSGKTTTALMLQRVLAASGVSVHVISMDNYYCDIDPENLPRSADGSMNYEAPELLDIPMLTAHFRDLAEGREVGIPDFSFSKQKRSDKVKPLRLGPDEIAIFEGIHALNPSLTAPAEGRSQRLYVTARTPITRNGRLFFEKQWLRLSRRLVRDMKFRGTGAAYTLGLWANVRRGEVRYIEPYKQYADVMIDTALPYEPCVMQPYALPLFEVIPEALGAYEELTKVYPRLSQFPALDEALLSKECLLREFIGGGDFRY